MKKFMAVVVSLCLVIGSSVSSYAADLNMVSKATLQRGTETEVIELPANLSYSEAASLKNNIMLYGNTRMTQSQVESIKKEAAARGGLVNGPWFGGCDKYYAMSLEESLSFTATILCIVEPFTSFADVAGIYASRIVRGICSVISVNSSIPVSVKAGSWVKADMAKNYREVKYQDGTFAYFETGFFANNLNVANRSYGSPVTIFSGGLY